MARDIEKDDDVQESLDSIEQRRGNIVKIPEGKTPIYILNSEYSDGYVHWIKSSEGPMRIVCGGGLEGKGWAPEDCGLCKKTAGIYSRAKSIEGKRGKDDPEVRKLRRFAGRIRSKYEAQFVATAGEMVREKRAGGKFAYVPEFEESDRLQVGILAFTRQQFEDFTALRGSEESSWIRSGKDLVNRIIVMDKKKRGKSDFATIKFFPSKKASDPPDVEWDEDELDPESNYEIDEERIEEALELLGETPDEEEEEVEFDDVEEEEKDDDDVLDDFEDGDDDDEEGDEDEDDDEEEGEDFEEEDEEEEEPPKKKRRTSRTSSKRTTAKKSGTTRKSTARKSSSTSKSRAGSKTRGRK